MISEYDMVRQEDDVLWKYDVPLKGNANFACIQHMVSKLAPSGTAGFVLANGSMSTNTTGEFEIRKKLIEEDLVECIVTLPGQLFYSTQIPVCLWFVTKNKAKNAKRERAGEILFIDAREIGYMSTRTLKEFKEKDIAQVADVYHAWRGTNDQVYEDVAGFCKVAKLEEVKGHDYILTPGRYVGLEEVEEDAEPFEEKMDRITSELSVQFKESEELESQIRKALEGIGYEI